MTRDELLDETEIFDGRIRIVIELPNGHLCSIKGLRYQPDPRNDAIIVLETARKKS